jgi:outer membrane lipoprotein-sorting protein
MPRRSPASRVAAGLRAGRFFAGALLFAATIAFAAPPDLLSRTDVFAAAPPSFQARIAVTDPTGKRAAVSLEVYRSGEDLALLRLLDPKEKGKFFLRRGRDLYFLAPGSARPLKLDPGHRLAGAVSFDEILGLRLTRDYEVERADEPQPGGAVTFHLTATSPAAPYPKVRWAVDPKRALPLRADLAFADGRAARVVEFVAWRDEKKLVPRKLRVVDILRGGAVEVEFQTFDARPLPAGLFTLEDGAERAKLP